tara:strand:- start:713 stop:1639 length:927 start_codon:yes stop_codon:yes gene_type:complete
MNKVAIVIFSYNRPDYLKKCLIGLKANKEFKGIPKFFFVDGPKNRDDEEKQKKIKKILDSIDDDASQMFFNKKNLGLKKSIINGIKHVFKKNKSAIIIEDDIVVGKFFLYYIINALKLTINKQKIFSISGYCYPHKIQNLKKNHYFLGRSCSWGWAIHKKNWEKIIFDKKKINHLLMKDYRNNLKKKFNNIAGENYYQMLEGALNDKIQSWAVYLIFTQIFYNKFTLYPKFSLTNNIGHEGNGTNSLKTDKWKNKNNTNIKIKIKSIIDVNNDIILTKSILKNFKIPLKQKLINETKNLISSFKTYFN